MDMDSYGAFVNLKNLKGSVKSLYIAANQLPVEEQEGVDGGIFLTRCNY